MVLSKMINRSRFVFNLSKINYNSLRNLILGIETSCDDTGVAVVDLNGNLISEHVHSQIKISSNIGGIIPTVARQMQIFHLDPTVQKVMSNKNLSFKDFSAIAVTVKPGLSLSLEIGRNYAVNKAKANCIPIIPIHHMEAHALTARMLDKNVDFPFMVFLISGGNCLLGLANDIEDFSLFGKKLDLSPGDCLEKIARRLNFVGNFGTHTDIAGGRAIELFAEENIDNLIDFPPFRSSKIDCNFTFSGLEGVVATYMKKSEQNGEKLNLPQFCASILHSMAFHMCRKLQRAMMYCHRYVDNPPKTLVVSGGVASNQFLRAAFQRVCDQFDYRLVCPPAKYCTDNGAMIAWNGYELFKQNKRIVYDADSVTYCPRTPFGVDRIEEITSKSTSIPKLIIKDLFVK